MAEAWPLTVLVHPIVFVHPEMLPLTQQSVDLVTTADVAVIS